MPRSSFGRPAQGIWCVISAVLLLTSIAGAPLTRAQSAVSPPAPPKTASAAVQANIAALPQAFEPNRGQADPQFAFLAHSANGAIGFSPSGLLIRQNIAAQTNSDPLTRATAPVSTTAATLGLSWQGSNPHAVLRAADQLPGVINYLHGNDPTHWQRDVPTYRALTYENLYPGIDLHYDGDGHGLKGTYTVAPGADPARIRWRYDGATAPALDPAGNLQIQARSDPAQSLSAAQQQAALVTEQAPVAWQEQANGRATVNARFALAADGSVGFALDAYDHTRPLVLDPYLLYSTYLGGYPSFGHGIKLDAAGAIYVAGTTAALPTVNPIQGQFGGFSDAFVSKVSPGGAALVYSTYLGGADQDGAVTLALDSLGRAYITGFSASIDYPVTPGAFDPTGHDTGKAIISVLNQHGDGLVYSTFLGYAYAGTVGYGIAVTADGWATVTGYVDSGVFPELHPLFAGRGFGQGFVARFSPGGVMDYGMIIPAATYITAVALDAAGNAYVGGYTKSYWLPVLHALQPELRGQLDGFVLALTADGSSEIYGTYIGGSATDGIETLAVDAAGEATIAGWSKSSDLLPPVGPLLHTPPIQPQWTGGVADGFVARLSATGSSLIFATYLGGNDFDTAYGVAVDDTGATYLTGGTRSANFPTSHAVQWRDNFPGGMDIFVTKLNPQGRAYVFSTYLGGGGGDYGLAIAVAADGTAYFTGQAGSDYFPLSHPIVGAGGGGGSFIAAIGDNCTQQFTDVLSSNPFYPYLRALACRGMVSGYADGSFHIGAQVTRSQMAKIVTSIMNSHIYIPEWEWSFVDVPQDNPFYWAVEQMKAAGIVSGYPCGQVPSEPCVSYDKPYFRPYAAITRAQAAKMMAHAARWNESVPARQQSFADILPGAAFWADIERLKAHGAIAGYTCGQTAGEPCDEQQRPYYRPFASITRGQASKIAASSFYPNDEVPSPTPTVSPTAAPTTSTKAGSRP